MSYTRSTHDQVRDEKESDFNLRFLQACARAGFARTRSDLSLANVPKAKVSTPTTIAWTPTNAPSTPICAPTANASMLIQVITAFVILVTSLQGIEKVVWTRDKDFVTRPLTTILVNVETKSMLGFLNSIAVVEGASPVRWAWPGDP